MMSDTDFFSYTCNDMSYVIEISIDGVIHAKKDFLKVLLQWVSGNLIEENPKKYHLLCNCIIKIS